MSSSEGTKFDQDKNRMELYPAFSFEAVSLVFTYGAKKYGDFNWEKGIPYLRLYGAVLRHLLAWRKGDNKDPETGYSHLWHAGAGINMLIWMEKFRTDLDNRPNKVDSNNEPI